MRGFLAVCLALAAIVAAELCDGPIQAQTGAAGSESKTVSFADATEAPAAAPVAAGRRTLSDREARRLGVNFRTVREAVKELKASGDLDPQASNAEIAAQVADHIASKKENAAAFKAGSIDFDALIAFIEKLLAIIMKFFP